MQRGFPCSWMMSGDGMNDMFIDETVGDYHFRRVEQGDKEWFMAVRAETSDVAEFYRRYPAFLDFSWEKILEAENEISMVVFHEPDDLLVGICSFQGLQSDSLELGYDIMKDLRGKGYGTGMVGALFELSHKVFPEREIFVRIRKENFGWKA